MLLDGTVGFVETESFLSSFFINEFSLVTLPGTPLLHVTRWRPRHIDSFVRPTEN